MRQSKSQNYIDANLPIVNSFFKPTKVSKRHKMFINIWLQYMSLNHTYFVLSVIESRLKIKTFARSVIIRHFCFLIDSVIDMSASIIISMRSFESTLELHFHGQLYKGSHSHMCIDKPTSTRALCWKPYIT